MELLCRYLTPPGQCGYLPEQTWRLEYEHVLELTAAEYLERLEQGWRRFGRALFHPKCRRCQACQSLRIPVTQFRPDRSQKRVRQANADLIRLEIGEPAVDRVRLELYDRYHAFQSEVKGWPLHDVKDVASYACSFVDNPFPTQEWRYYLGDRLVGIGYVDDLPRGLSAIYFIYDPEERHRSLGTWNILCQLENAAARGLPYLYLGYYVAGCPSMVYKNRFVPNEVLGPDGWRPFRS